MEWICIRAFIFVIRDERLKSVRGIRNVSRKGRIFAFTNAQLTSAPRIKSINGERNRKKVCSYSKPTNLSKLFSAIRMHERCWCNYPDLHYKRRKLVVRTLVMVVAMAEKHRLFMVLPIFPSRQAAKAVLYKYKTGEKGESNGDKVKVRKIRQLKCQSKAGWQLEHTFSIKKKGIQRELL